MLSKSVHQKINLQNLNWKLISKTETLHARGDNYNLSFSLSSKGANNSLSFFSLSLISKGGNSTDYLYYRLKKSDNV